jgi:hypothetical protein
MVRSPFRTVSWTLASVLMLAACGDGLIDPAAGNGTLIVRADVSATAVATLVAEVTAADIPTALLFNIPISAGVASGTIVIPAGSNRTVALRAYDAGGILTHMGSTELDLHPGPNAAVAITLTPLTGDQAIVATLGSFTITVTPSSPPVGVGGTVQLGVSIVDWNGNPTTGTVSWATQDPGIATVDASGLVTGAGVGSTKIAATFHGATGTATVVVGP